MSIDNKLQVVNFPNETTGDKELKIVELTYKNEDYLVLQHTNFNTHGLILLGFLKEKGISYEQLKWNSEDDKKYYNPALEDSINNYSVKGMGKMTINTKEKKVYLPYGVSTDYQILPDKNFNPLIKEHFENSGYKVFESQSWERFVKPKEAL